MLIARDLLRKVRSYINCEIRRTIACHEWMNEGDLCMEYYSIAQDDVLAKCIVMVENEISNWSLLRINMSSRLGIIDLYYFLNGLMMIESIWDNLTFRVYRRRDGTINETATWTNIRKLNYKYDIIVTGDIFMSVDIKKTEDL